MWCLIVEESHDYDVGSPWVVEFKDKGQAESLADRLNAWLQQNNVTAFAQVVEVQHASRYDWPKASAAEIAKEESRIGRKLKPSEIAIDVEKLAEMMSQGDVPELLPEPVPVSDSEVEAAIRSITGAAE